MTTRIAALLAAALALPAAAAGADEKTTPYYPLQVGAAWTYKTADGGHFTLRVAKAEKAAGDVPAFRVEMLRDGKVESSEVVAVRDDGVYRYAFENKTADKPVCFLKLPPKKGETWPVDSKVKGAGGDEALKGTFKSDEEEEVAVPAGKYACVKVSSDDLDVNGVKWSVAYYFAKDVGLVKQVIETAGQKTDAQLEKYEPPAAKPDK